MNKILKFTMAMLLCFIMIAGGAVTAFAETEGAEIFDEVIISEDISDELADDTPTFEEDTTDFEEKAAANVEDTSIIEEYIPTEATLTTLSFGYSSVSARSLEQVSTFAELQNVVGSAVNGVEKRIEIVADFTFDGTISIQNGRIITLYANSNYRLTAPSNTRHFNVSGTLNLESGIALVGNGGNGGGVSNNGTFNMSGNSAIRGNMVYSETSAVYGGGVQNSGTFTMTDNAKIDGNSAISTISASYGGGVNFGHGRIEMSGNAAIVGNTNISKTSAAYGGGVYQHGGIFTMTDNAVISDNIVRSESGSMAVGGGIHSGYTSTLNMSGDAAISDNQAESGGGVWMSYSNSRLFMSDNASITGNTASRSAGGVSLGFDSVLQMNGGRISGNTAPNGGGVSSSSSSFVHIVSGEISNNTAQNGGGISAVLENLTVGANAVFFGNSADRGYPNRNPADDTVYEQNIKGTRWTQPFTQGYNNYDISYINDVSVSFNGNGGSPSWDSRRLAFGTALGADMPSNPTRTNFIFVEWNAQPNSTGSTFGSTTVVESNMVVYAIWQTTNVNPITPEVPLVRYTVMYDGNGHNSGNVPIDGNSYIFNTIATVLDKGDLQRTAHTFIGWNTEANGSGTDYAVGDTLTITGHITLFAQWEAVQSPPTLITVTFDGNGGTVLAENRTRQVATGTSLGVTMPSAAPTRNGFTFNGWNTAQNGSGTAFTSTTNVTANITVYAGWTQNQTPPPQQGRMNITNVADGSRERLAGGVFGIYHAMNDQKIIEVETDLFGEAFALLNAGDYYLRQIVAPSGYQLNNDRFNFTIKANEVTEVTVINKANPTITPPTVQQGSLLVTAIAEGSGAKIAGVRLAVYHSQTNAIIETLITDRYGEAFIELPIGDYFLRVTSVPSGYILNTDRIGFRIQANRLTEVTVRLKQIPTEPETTTPPTTTPTTPPTPPTTTPTQPPTTTPTTPTNPTTPTTPPTSGGNSGTSTTRPTLQGVLQIITRAEQSGNLLSGAVFDVYRVSDDTKITELTTGADGKATYTLAPGEYYLRQTKATFGYLPETARILFTVIDGQTVVVEVTNRRDPNVADIDIITLPQTGQSFPIANIVAGIVMLVAAVLCATKLWEQYKNKRRTVLDLA